MADMVAKGVAGSFVVLLLAWRKLWGMRQDLRTDHAATRDDEAGKRAQEVLERTIERLEEQIKRMDEDVREWQQAVATLNKRVNEELGLRYTAEGALRRSEYRAQGLEAELEALKAKQQ
jgi:chromosome segregation ATPase